MTVARADDHSGVGAGVENGDSLDAQRDFINKMLKKSLVKGDKWYLLDHKWFKQWKKYVGYDQWETANIGDPSSNPGPINNSCLLTDTNNPEDLREHLIDELDYVLLPEEAWNKLTGWYGLAPNQKPIARTVVDFGMFLKNLKVEIYRMELKLCIHPNLKDLKSYCFSKVATLEEVEQVTRKLFDVPESAHTRLWNRFSTNTLELINDKTKTIQDESLYSAQVIVLEVQNPDGSWPRNSLNAADTTNQISCVEHTTYCKPTSATGVAGGSSYRSRSSGLCGLTNLGNTCFMNSALQCMSNVPQLTEYFLSDRYLADINRENPLGMHGEIAESYAALIKAIWSGEHLSYSPKIFKQKVGRFAPQFNGYMQQDCQELMSFLLDGLHEDLNRVKKKPYIEAKNSEGKPDNVLAKEAWSNYLKRNDSVIVDTFHGLLKSTLICPECHHVSITFDPFCYLSLPLPNHKEKFINIVHFPYKPSEPYKVRLSIPVSPVKCTGKKLYSIVETSVDVPANMLVICTIRADKTIDKIIEPNEQELGDTTVSFHVYTVSTPWNNTAGSLVRVYTRELADSENEENAFSYAKVFGVPFFIHLPNKTTTLSALYKETYEWLAARFISDKKNGNDNRMDVDDEDDQPVSTLPEKGAEPLFEVSVVNEIANTRLCEPKENSNGLGENITLQNRAYVVLDFKSETKKQFYDESKCSGYIQNDPPKSHNINNKKAIDLSECLDLFTTKEQLGVDDLWYCPVCKKHQQATKMFNLWSLPPVLIIHLKRFSYNRYFREKLDTLIDYPINNLLMDKWVLDPKRKPIPYDLIGVANHSGHLGAGHYTAHAKNKLTGRWHNFDDLDVSIKPESNIVSKQAYVLFYQRRDMSTATNGTDNADATMNNGSLRQDFANSRMTTRSQVNNSTVSDDEMDESVGYDL